MAMNANIHVRDELKISYNLSIRHCVYLIVNTKIANKMNDDSN